jgi:hypothetical protein
MQSTTPAPIPSSQEELRASLLAPYERLRTVLFEALPWRACLDRYDDPRSLLVLEPPWPAALRDEWTALQLRLRRAHFQWQGCQDQYQERKCASDKHYLSSAYL